MQSLAALNKRVTAAEQMVNYQCGLLHHAPIGICSSDKTVLRTRFYGGELTNQAPLIHIPARMERWLFPKRYKIVYGGRCSAKTTTLASLATERLRTGSAILCCREIFRSIKQSTHKCLRQEVERRDLRGVEIVVTNEEISSMNTPGMATFARLKDNPEAIKGSERLDVVWVDEAENISIGSWTVLSPTLRESGSEIWISFNPRFEEDPTWTEYVQPYVDRMVDGIYEDDTMLIIKSNYMDNPWISQESLDEMNRLKERDYDRYLWQWRGLFNKRSEIQVMYGKWKVEAFDVESDWAGPYFGADFGFARDPSTLIKFWAHKEVLYIEYEAWGIGVDLDEMPKFYDEIPEARDHRIYGDCSRPETISHLKNRGFRMRAGDKWPGSVEDGITYLRGFKQIIIHTRCVETAKEFKLYSYKVKELTEEILPVVEDKFNHCIDAIRYGLHKFIKRKNSFWDM